MTIALPFPHPRSVKPSKTFKPLHLQGKGELQYHWWYIKSYFPLFVILPLIGLSLLGLRIHWLFRKLWRLRTNR